MTHTDEEYDFLWKERERQTKAKYDAEFQLRICQDANWKLSKRIKELEEELVWLCGAASDEWMTQEEFAHFGDIQNKLMKSQSRHEGDKAEEK